MGVAWEEGRRRFWVGAWVKGLKFGYSAKFCEVLETYGNFIEKKA